MSPTASLDRRRLQSYLGDHLTGADAGRARALKMKEWYADDELGPEMARVADEIDEDHAHLDRLIGRLGLRQPLPFRAAARLGETNRCDDEQMTSRRTPTAPDPAPTTPRGITPNATRRKPNGWIAIGIRSCRSSGSSRPACRS